MLIHFGIHLTGFLEKRGIYLTSWGPIRMFLELFSRREVA